MRRGLEILLALGEGGANGGLGVVRVAELVGREKSQVSRSLKTLAEYGLVERDRETLAYRLGPRLLALGARASDARLLAEAPGALRRLVEALRERAHLSVLAGTDVLTLQSQSPPHAVQAAGWVGRTVPAYCTSSGRALLLDHGSRELKTLFAGVEFRPLGPGAPRDVDELYERILAARTRGFALVDEEFESGLVAAAAPVRNFHGRIVAALDVSAPKFRFRNRLESAGHELATAAADLSRVLGWTDG